ncbi:hypothetical protein ACTA71_007138 [Dictyostelium dimigraforme]
MELQSRWSCYVFANIVRLPPKEIMLKGVEEAKEIRNSQYKHFVPFKNLAVFYDSLAREMGCLPNFEEIKENNPQLYEIFWKCFICPATYRLIGPFSNYEKSMGTIIKYAQIQQKYLS